MVVGKELEESVRAMYKKFVKGLFKERKNNQKISKFYLF
jgi:hypothetical protein